LCSWWRRGAEYDEGYSVFVTSGVPRPDWPTTPFTPAQVWEAFTRHTGPVTIAEDLRRTDVHPPLYFWALGAWRAVAGDSLEALRVFSVLLSLGTVAAWMATAWRAGAPPVAAGLFTALSYGFAYTGHVARGFAMAHLWVALAAWAAVEAWRRPGRAGLWAAAAAGLCGGLASFSNYLAAFPAAAVLLWLALARWRSFWTTALAAGIPFLAMQAANLSFFLHQSGSRPDQFVSFSPVDAAKLLAQFNAANIFGGLPLYAEGELSRALLAGLLAALLLASALAVAVRFRSLGAPGWLGLLGFAAPSAGVALLGMVFAKTPIELRYLAFAAPFAGLLVASAAAAWTRAGWRRLAVAGLGLVLLVQAAGVAGMALHPATRQVQRDALQAVAPLLGPGSVLLLPFGNDGVGLVGAALREAPRNQPVLVLRLDDAASAPARMKGFQRAVLLAITDRDGAIQAEAAANALLAQGWREDPIPWRDTRRGYTARVFTR
jgi:4-amino-4-deoxy-L-arabinose transferase-like glycosyltransferase